MCSFVYSGTFLCWCSCGRSHRPWAVETLLSSSQQSRPLSQPSMLDRSSKRSDFGLHMYSGIDPSCGLQRGFVLKPLLVIWWNRCVLIENLTFLWLDCLCFGGYCSQRGETPTHCPPHLQSSQLTTVFRYLDLHQVILSDSGGGCLK